MADDKATGVDSPSERARTARGEIRTVSALDLLGPAGVVHIEHEGEVYTLRRTRLGRLILTK